MRCKPFLRWPGGKRWLAGEIAKQAVNVKFTRYIEPFLGGGAVFFEIRPKNALLSDINTDLTCTYNIIKTNSHKLVNKLQQIPVSKEKYYELRASEPISAIDKAVKFLYLNRLAFAGMYRVNKAGKFNVPYGDGRRVDILWTNELIAKASNALQNAEIVSADFEEIISRATHGDFVYCDPTYTASHNNNGFIRYNENVFKWEDQIRLAKSVVDAVERGATVFVSNAAHETITDLYPVLPRIVSRHTCISSKPHGRKRVDEFLFMLSPKG